MTVRPADSAPAAAVPKSDPAPAQTQTNQARPAEKTEQAAAVPDSFARKSGGGLSIPSPGDIIRGIGDGISNIFNKVKDAVSDAFNGAKDLAEKAGNALN